MPTATDLVTDLPADFEVFGQAVATSMADLLGGTTGQMLTKQTNTDMDFAWVTPQVGDITGVTAGTGISGGGTSGTVTVTNSMATAITTSGDLVQGTGSGTFARLGTGTSGQVLTTNGTTNSWGYQLSSFAQVGSATTLSGTSTTVSSIPSKDKMLIVVNGASYSGASTPNLRLTLNGDTSAVYTAMGNKVLANTTYAASMFNSVQQSGSSNGWIFGTPSTGAGSTYAYFLLTGCNSTGFKSVQCSSGSNGTSPDIWNFGGFYAGTSAITSVTVDLTVNSFDAGTISIYTSN